MVGDSFLQTQFLVMLILKDSNNSRVWLCRKYWLWIGSRHMSNLMNDSTPDGVDLHVSQYIPLVKLITILLQFYHRLGLKLPNEWLHPHYQFTPEISLHLEETLAEIV